MCGRSREELAAIHSRARHAHQNLAVAVVDAAMDWHFGDVFETVAAALPERAVVVSGERQLPWREFDARANGVANDLIASGVSRQGKVMAPANVNYRYGASEVAYLFENADAEAAVFDVEFAPLLDSIRRDLPLVKRWIAVGDPAEVPDWAVAYEEVARPVGSVVTQGRLLGGRHVVPRGQGGDAETPRPRRPSDRRARVGRSSRPRGLDVQP